MEHTGGVLYEVVISISPEIKDDYLSWLNPHVDEMLGFDGFKAAKIYVNSEDENEITCLYWLRDMQAMQAYLDGPAQEMRADGVKRFGEKISARRRILTAQ